MATTLATSEQCTFKLPDRSRVALQGFLKRTYARPNAESPNEVMARQSECPAHMTLGEFKALASLPYGYRIQWLNVLTQLAMPTVDFNKAEAATFLLQMSLQAGPNSVDATERCSHQALCEPEFGRKMLEQLRVSVSRIRENWKSHGALWIYTFLAARLLSLADKSLTKPLLHLLAECRSISYQWLAKLRQSAHETTDDRQRAELQTVILDISLICADSFNVDDECLGQILSESEQSSILIEISVGIHNNANLLGEGTQVLQKARHDRWVYTLHRARPVLAQQVKSSEGAAEFLNLAIKRCWPDFEPDNGWSVSSSTCHWFETKSSSSIVHLDILTGTLLIDGRPLSCLPSKYEKHADYRRLFRRSKLDVMPSSLLGMQYCSTEKYKGHTVHFGMQEDSNSDAVSHDDLWVCLKKDDATTLELVPPRTISGVLPYCFVNDYIHWSATKIAEILSPLEARLELHMLRDQNTGDLSVEMPRLQLGFEIKQGESLIRSRQFRGMCIDSKQTVGSLLGFSSKLVLRDEADEQNRKILIPQGTISWLERKFACFGTHVDASVTYGNANRVQAYQIDDLLGQLKDSGKIESKLYLALIHATTSHCLPDPLTRRTGTEQALEILGSAAVRSAGFMSQTAMSMLESISALSPARHYYPQEERAMQVVSWSPGLSFLAQDSRLYKAVRDILERAEAARFLHPTAATDVVKLKLVEMDLVEREILRNADRCVSGFGAEASTNEHDTVYHSRDVTRSSERAGRVSEVVHRIHNGLLSLPLSVSPNLADHLYDLLKAETAKGQVDLDLALEGT
ncbi:hypothetical protein CDD83_4569 [Cordyceps sp. RAO-2017]|nr:hypothetical protein CDD83_4569 [Cordyceps sp. RAO-2017]